MNDVFGLLADSLESKHILVFVDEIDSNKIALNDVCTDNSFVQYSVRAWEMTMARVTYDLRSKNLSGSGLVRWDSRR